MKHLPIILTVLILSVPAEAVTYYAVDNTGRAVAKSKEPFSNKTSLESRGEKQVDSPLDLPLDQVVIENDRIKERAKTQAEKAREKYESELDEEEALIALRSRKLAYDSLVAEGIKFKYATDSKGND